MYTFFTVTVSTSSVLAFFAGGPSSFSPSLGFSFGFGTSLNVRINVGN